MKLEHKFLYWIIPRLDGEVQKVHLLLLTENNEDVDMEVNGQYAQDFYGAGKVIKNMDASNVPYSINLINNEGTDVNYVLILDDNTPASVIAGTELAVSVEASDNIVIDTAYVEYWYAGTERLTSVLEIGPILETTIEIPADAEGPLLYMIILVDSSGIRTEGETMTVEIERGPVDADQNVALYAFLGLVSSAAFAIIILFLLLLLRRSGKVRSGGEE